MRDLGTLLDIYQSILLVFNYTQNITYKQLKNNQEKQDAILRRITIVGEATKRLSPEFRDKHSTIPWKQIAGMRDIISHKYDDLTNDLQDKQQLARTSWMGEYFGQEIYSTIFRLEESPHKQGEIWAGSDDGLIHLTKDGGKTWENVTPPNLQQSC